MTAEQCMAIEEFMDKHQVSVEVLNGPTGVVREEMDDGVQVLVPYLDFDVRLHCGEGYVDMFYSVGLDTIRIRYDQKPSELTDEEHHIFNVMQGESSAQPVNPDIHASLAAKLAKAQKVKPDRFAVLRCIMAGFHIYSNGYTFEDICEDQGMNPDSRSAYKAWEEMVEVGRQVARNIGRDVALEFDLQVFRSEVEG